MVMAKARKIGEVKRKPGTFVWVDKKGNVWEKPIKKGSRRSRRRK